MAENTSTFTGAAADGTALTAVYLTQPAANVAIGLVFAGGSPRQLSPAQARTLRLALAPMVDAVALFRDNTAADVEQVLRLVRPSLLQFHGDEDDAFCRSFGVPYLKAVPMGGDARYLAAVPPPPPPPGWGAGMPPGAMPAPLPPRELAGPAAYGGQAVADAPAPVPLSPELAPGLAKGGADRWSADVWTLARKDSPFPLTSGRPVYGGSQAGAVLRYRLAPNSAYRPTAYLRANTALGAVRESEIALGLAARPIAALPLVLAAEARAFRSASGRKSFRPATLAYTELPPFALPAGFTGEAYLQGGYVGGAFKTGFVDGQLRVERPLIDVAGHRLSLGGGIWGGAQKGAARLDTGPGMSALVDLWGRSSRVSLDWRFRVTGDAEPKSGPAVTVSAGF